MTFVQAVKTVFAKYATFTGRAPRSEYWWFSLFTFVVSLVLMVLEGDEERGYNILFQSLSTIFTLATLVPSLAVGSRRLHDTNRSGWRQLWALTLIGLVPLIYWFCQRGTEGPNRFGGDPLAQAPEPETE
jgi:uncharacterized membrane protein YhaH (DUF805 family)